MSDSFFKPAPDPVRPEILDKAGKVLHQPITLAVLASLGIHGLLWLGLPALTASRLDKPQDQRSVGVVELSPLEQSRLPDVGMSQSQTQLPKTAKSKSSKLVDPLADPLGTFGVPPTPTAIAPIRPTPYYKLSPDVLSAPLPKSSDPFIVISRSSTKKADKKTEPALTQPVETQPAGEEPSAPTTEETQPDPSTTAEGLRGSTLLEKSANSQPNEQALGELYAFNPSDPGMKEEVAARNLQEFSNANGIDVQNLPKVEAQSIALPKQACQFQEQLKEAMKQGVGIGVVPESEGNPAKVVLLRSSGSTGLNQAALEYIRSQLRPDEKNNFFNITFDASKTDCSVAGTEKPAS